MLTCCHVSVYAQPHSINNGPDLWCNNADSFLCTACHRVRRKKNVFSFTFLKALISRFRLKFSLIQNQKAVSFSRYFYTEMFILGFGQYSLRRACTRSLERVPKLADAFSTDSLAVAVYTQEPNCPDGHSLSFLSFFFCASC